MNSIPALRHWAALACAAALTAAWPAHAATYALGPVNGPTTFSFDDVSHTEPFQDVFTFSVAAGASLSFSAFIDTPYSNWFWINDLDGRLEHDGTTVIDGDTHTVLQPFPKREVSFAAQTLAAGDYALRLFGTPTAVFPGPRSSYDGTFTFAAVAAPVPEPETVVLMAMGLAAVAAVARRRRG